MKRGFTLIEIIVALCLLAIIAAAFSFFFNSGIKNLLSTQEFTAALNSAQAQMEGIRAKGFEEIKDQTFDNGRGKIAVRPIAYDLLEIRLTLNWKEGRKPIEFVTARAK